MPRQNNYPGSVADCSRPMARDVGPLDPPRRLLMGSGPSNPEPRVLQAMAAAPIAPDDPAYGALLDDVSSLARAVFQTANTSTLAVPGASRAGLEAVVASLVEPGERVVVGVYGHFGELLCTLAERHGATVERIASAAWGSPVRPEDIVASVHHNPPKLVAIVHADTSTGILQPLEAIGNACRETGTLFMVDAVLSLGGCQLDVDGWSVDAAIGGMQKCLGGPPGLAPLTCSERALDARKRRSTLPHSAYLDLARLQAQWIGRPGLETATMPISDPPNRVDPRSSASHVFPAWRRSRNVS